MAGRLSKSPSEPASIGTMNSMGLTGYLSAAWEMPPATQPMHSAIPKTTMSNLFIIFPSFLKKRSTDLVIFGEGSSPPTGPIPPGTGLHLPPCSDRQFPLARRVPYPAKAGGMFAPDDLP